MDSTSGEKVVLNYKSKCISALSIIPTLGRSQTILNIEDEFTIEPGVTFKVPHGLTIHSMPKNIVGLIMPYGDNKYLGLHVSMGLIDRDYRGPISTCVKNLTNKPITLLAGTAVSVLNCLSCIEPVDINCDAISVLDRTRGSDGFGSSDKYIKKE